jgi:hypothetical protein
MKDLGAAGVRWLVSLVAGGLLVLHLAFPTLPVDAVTLGLLVILILPWTSPLLETLELPGGWKIKFQNLQSASEKITGANPPPDPVKEAAIKAAAAPVLQEEDPQLSLVALRIEIEKRLRAIAKIYGLPENRSLSITLKALSTKGVLNPPTANGLQELVWIGNQAAHGVKVDMSGQLWAQLSGPKILAILDELLAKGGAAQQGDEADA